MLSKIPMSILILCSQRDIVLKKYTKEKKKEKCCECNSKKLTRQPVVDNLYLYIYI